MAATITAEITRTLRGTLVLCYPLFAGSDGQLVVGYCGPGDKRRAVQTPTHAAMAMSTKQSGEFDSELHCITKAASGYLVVCHGQTLAQWAERKFYR